MIDDLRRDGVAVLPDRFDRVAAFVDHLAALPFYPNHVRQGAAPAPLGSRPWMCHDQHDVIRAPDFFETALRLTPLAAEILEAPPLLYSLNAFYAEPDASPKPDIQEFHRDRDDARFVALFLYGGDVLTEADGPHEFVIGSHLDTDDGVDLAGREARAIYGSAGTLFLGLTRGIHRGLVPRTKRRLLAWARWGIGDPPAAYQWDGLSPLPRDALGDRYPADPHLREAIRLVVS